VQIIIDRSITVWFRAERSWQAKNFEIQRTSVTDPYSVDPDPAFLAEYLFGSRVLITNNEKL
jgi:hypothetical protein